MNAVVENLLASPTLPETVARLNTALLAERQRRARFYEEITPEMKAEFINGQVIMHSPASNEHTEIRGLIENLLTTYINSHDLGQVRGEKSLCVFPRNDYEPDVIFFGPEKAARLRRKTLKFPVPDFACEILSDSTARRDRGVKFEDYEAHGVREYWIVNPDRRELEQYVLEKGRYTLRMKSRTGEVASAAIKGFRAPLAAFFDAKANLRRAAPDAGLAALIGSRKGDVRGNFRVQFVDEFRLHELVVVGDEQDGALVFEGLGELAAEAIEMGFLHEKNDVGPADVSLGDDDAGAGLRARGANLKTGNAAEDALRGEAANAIAAAEEQQLGGKPFSGVHA